MVDVFIYIVRCDCFGWLFYPRKEEHQVAYVVLPGARIIVLAGKPVTELSEF